MHYTIRSNHSHSPTKKMKKKIISLIALTSLAVNSAIAGINPPPPELENISDYEISLKYNFTGTCVANDVVKETESSLKAFVTYFTITEEDVLERDEGAYLVGDLDGEELELVIAIRETGEIVGSLGIADETIFTDALDPSGAQVTKYLATEDSLGLTTKYSSGFTLELDGYTLLLKTSASLRYSDAVAGDPLLDLRSTALFGEGYENPFLIEPGPFERIEIVEPEDKFMVLTGTVSARGTIAEVLVD